MKTEHNQPTEESLFLKREDTPAPSKHQHKTLQPPKTILWRESPTTLTRDRAPSHKIPKAQRFCCTKIDLLKHQQLESMQLERESFKNTGISFPRSNRPEHFAKHEMTITPSPNAYHFARFVDSIQYKAKTERSLSKSPYKKQSEIKYSTMNNFFNYHKTYLPHGKNIPYQPECTIDNPSPAHYNPNCTVRSKDIKYSFNHHLKRFKEISHNSPGPAAYRDAQERSNSFNAKGTFPKSNRTYLRTIEQKPAPNQYSIARFLQQ